jgi:spermidine synthase
MPGSAVTAFASGVSPRLVLVAVFAAGFSSILTQLVLMREMLGAFAGSELVLGIVLGNWLLSMGLGAFPGRFSFFLKHARMVMPAILVIMAVLPPAQVFLLRGLRTFVFMPGATLGIAEIWLTSLLTLLPYCLPAGCFLALASSVQTEAQSHGPGRVYAMDCLGSVVGGALFSFVLVMRLDHWTLLWLPGSINLGVAALFVKFERFPARGEGQGEHPSNHGLGFRCKTFIRHIILSSTGFLLFAAAACGIGLFCIVRFNPDMATAAMQFPGQNILFASDSPYGRLTVTESGGQTNFLENGLLVAACPNIEQAEESVHYAMAQRPKGGKVLLIGGLLSGCVPELMRHDVSELDCVELDPLVAHVARQFLPESFASPKVRIIEADARQFIRTAAKRYDVVIMVLPDPVTLQLNRFFTEEFYRDVKNCLAVRGVFGFALGHYENAVSDALAQTLRCAGRTLDPAFANNLVIPGQRNYFIASDGPLATNIAERLTARGITPRFVNEHYLKTVFAPDRVGDLRRALQQDLKIQAPVNTDFKPVLCYLQLRHWASQFHRLPLWILLCVTLPLLVYLLRLKGVYFAIFASGFGGSAMEILLLLAIQVLAGSVYRQVGLVVAVFMAGLATGSYAASRWLEKFAGTQEDVLRQNANTSRPLAPANRALAVLALAISMLCLALPWFLKHVLAAMAMKPGGAPIQIFVCLFTFGLAFAVGAQFPIASQTQDKARNSISRLYESDFVGASFGAFLTGALLAPLLGAAAVCIIAGVLNLTASLLLLFKGKYEPN